MVASAFLIFGLPFVVALAVGIVVFSVYVLLAKKFRLNWFEKNLLENAVQVAEDQTEETADSGFLTPFGPGARILPLSPMLVRLFPLLSITAKQSANLARPPGELSVPGSLARAASDVIPGPDEEERGRTSFESRPRIPSMHSSLDIGMIDSALYVTHVSNPALYVTLVSDPYRLRSLDCGVPRRSYRFLSPFPVILETGFE
ncbi:unnamed protein product [Darwinula stevensoni]|uniref:Uncharacterized protein n=1 Tax=Darwinula stevensoni TaxID=69355 RepID=A0A7R9AEU3_9CRUS|nr:unnamed protein product [Darwinula stevensoni]CAG0902245.1 unnamed protein product [Darwinula stevensoni]